MYCVKPFFRFTKRLFMNVSQPHIKSYMIETYGCQMNFNDTEIVMSILNSKKFERTDSVQNADIILLMTCAIRENAEDKIWKRLEVLRSIERKRRNSMIIGVLGCMAERLKSKLLESDIKIDLVCGPDSYRDLPRLLEVNDSDCENGKINVLLSMEETYADITPIRLDNNKKHAYISIMRGCNNMCAFCVVPFTRGRERSRPMESIISEGKTLMEHGIKEITLLGQNVNNYLDVSNQTFLLNSSNELSKGFNSIYKTKDQGKNFIQLLEELSDALPNVRLRFTSPHPKNFPISLLHLIKNKKNICKQIHLPAQSGSSSVLERMRRGYDREAYLKLVDEIRAIIPEISLSTDLIVGFCGETDDEFNETLSLLDKINYNMAYMFEYSMREKTMAHRRYIDDVPKDLKNQRLRILTEKFYNNLKSNSLNLINMEFIGIIEDLSHKSKKEYTCRGDDNRTYIVNSNDSEHVITGDIVLCKVIDIKGATPIAKIIKKMNGFY